MEVEAAVAARAAVAAVTGVVAEAAMGMEIAAMEVEVTWCLCTF